MTTPGKARRTILVLAAVGTVSVAGWLAIRIVDSREEPSALDADTPALADFTLDPGGRCEYEPEHGGLVAHLDVRTRDVGRFTVDVEAITAEGADNLDITTPHAVRVTVPFHGARAGSGSTWSSP